MNSFDVEANSPVAQISDAVVTHKPSALVTAPVLPEMAPQVEVLNHTSVSLVVPDGMKQKVGGVSDYVRDRLETELVTQAVDAWKALQVKMVQSFGEMNTLHPQGFPLEYFLADALEEIGNALTQHGVARLTSVDTSTAQVSLGFDRQAVPGSSKARNLLKLLQIIERVYKLTDEEASVRLTYTVRINALTRQKGQLEERLNAIPGGNHVNDPVRRDIDRDIDRVEAELKGVGDSISKLDKRVADVIVAAEKMLNVQYQPDEPTQVLQSFLDRIQEVPSVASRVSPKELRRLPGDILLPISVDLPKAEPLLKSEAALPSVPKSSPSVDEDGLPPPLRFNGPDITFLPPEVLAQVIPPSVMDPGVYKQIAAYIAGHMPGYKSIYRKLVGKNPPSESTLAFAVTSNYLVLHLDRVPVGAFARKNGTPVSFPSKNFTIIKLADLH